MTARRLAFALVALLGIMLIHPAIASADISFPDPMQYVQNSTTQGWFTTLQSMAGRLYIGLFTIELIIVGVQGMLYKDNIGEFIQTFAFKIIVATLMIAVIGNANLIFPKVVDLFKQTAINTVNANCPPAQAPCASDSNPTSLEGTFVAWAATYFLAADLSRVADSAASSASGIMVFGTGLPGLSTAFLMGHANFQLFCMAMGMMCIMSAAGIFLTFMLLTFETQIIMMLGVFFLAFHGSRFTAQFSQGYMSYCINVGTKFFVYFFVVAILQVMTSDASFAGLIAGLAGGAAIPFGAMSITLVAATSSVPVIAIVSSVLVAAIPNFAGSLLSGSSALSAGSAMGQISGTFAAANAMNAAAQQDQKAAHTNHDAQHAKRDLSHGHSAHTQQTHTAVDHAPAGQQVQIGPASANSQPEHTWNVGGNIHGSTGTNGAAHHEQGGHTSLQRMTPAEIDRMRPEDMSIAASSTDWGDLNKGQRDAIAARPELRDAASDAYDKKAKDSHAAHEGHQSSMLGSLLQGVTMRSEPPPPAVQVRMTNPDKL